MGIGLKLGLGLSAVMALSACDHKTLTVESDTTWQGDVTGYGSFGGSGGGEVDLDNAPDSFCWTFTKKTSAGTLRAYVHHEDWLGLRDEFVGDATTTEPNGTIGGCI